MLIWRFKAHNKELKQATYLGAGFVMSKSKCSLSLEDKIEMTLHAEDVRDNSPFFLL